MAAAAAAADIYCLLQKTSSHIGYNLNPPYNIHIMRKQLRWAFMARPFAQVRRAQPYSGIRMRPIQSFHQNCRQRVMWRGMATKTRPHSIDMHRNIGRRTRREHLQHAHFPHTVDTRNRIPRHKHAHLPARPPTRRTNHLPATFLSQPLNYSPIHTQPQTPTHPTPPPLPYTYIHIPHAPPTH